MSLTPAPLSSFSFPTTKKIYGVVVDQNTQTATILKVLDTISKLDGDLVLFLSVLPHDVTTRPDWDLISKAVRVRGYQGKQFEVRYINQADIPAIADEISVLQA